MKRFLKVIFTVLIAFFVLIVVGVGYVKFALAAPLAEISVSEPLGTRLEVELHWTGAFSGSQHDEYLVYYVRFRGLFTSSEKKLICSRNGNSSDLVGFRRINDSQIEFVRWHNGFEKENALPGEVLMRFSFADSYPEVATHCNI